MNKKIYKLAVGLIFVLGMNSCEDFLDVRPPEQLSDPVFWQTEKDVNLALAGAYHGWESSANILFLDAMSDNGYERFNYGWRHKINGQVTPTNVLSTANWTEPASGNVASWFNYGGIRKYNNFITKVDGVENLDGDAKERYKAEVRFLRAYDYFNKVMFFGDMPFVIELVPSNVKMGRTPEAEIKQFILNELEQISKILPEQNVLQSQGHVTAGAALALKARLELYMGRFDDALKSAKAVIDMGVYELFPDYRGLFLKTNNSINKESILEVQYIKDHYAHMLPQLMLPRTEGGWSALVVTQALVDAYETGNGLSISEDHTYNPENPFDDRDPRLEMTVLYPGSLWNGRYYNNLDANYLNSAGDMVPNPDYRLVEGNARGVLQIRKYMEPVPVADMGNYDGNIMVIRLAEMYLTFAEAALETGQQLELALEYVNALRQRVGHSEATELTKALVRRERRVELAFEGLRYFDIKRWNLGPEVLEGGVYSGRSGTMNSQTGAVTWDQGEYILLENRNFIPERNYLLPIPQSERDVNPNMTPNDGY